MSENYEIEIEDPIDGTVTTVSGSTQEEAEEKADQLLSSAYPENEDEV